MTDTTRPATWADLVRLAQYLDEAGEGLLLTKEGMRDRDRADAAALRRALEIKKNST